MNEYAKANWLRKPGQECWQMEEDLTFDDVQKAAIRKTIEMFGFIY